VQIKLGLERTRGEDSNGAGGEEDKGERGFCPPPDYFFGDYSTLFLPFREVSSSID